MSTMLPSYPQQQTDNVGLESVQFSQTAEGVPVALAENVVTEGSQLPHGVMSMDVEQQLVTKEKPKLFVPDKTNLDRSNCDVWRPLVNDTVVLWKGAPSWRMLYEWIVDDPMSRPWYWVRSIVLMMVDIGLVAWNYSETEAHVAAHTILICMVPIQVSLVLVQLYYLGGSLRRYGQTRDQLLSQLNVEEITDAQQVKLLYDQNDTGWSFTREQLMVPLVTFCVDFGNYIASLYLMGTDPGNMSTVSLALGVFSVIDMGLTLHGFFTDFFNRFTNRPTVKRTNMCCCFVTFFPVLVIALLGYSAVVAYFGYDLEQDTQEIYDEYNITQLQTNDTLILFSPETLPGTISTAVLSVLFVVAFSIMACTIGWQYFGMPKWYRVDDLAEGADDLM